MLELFQEVREIELESEGMHKATNILEPANLFVGHI